jgi:hypothetical protein
MRRSTVIVCCLFALSSGCSTLDSNSRWNVNRGDYNDEFMVRKEARGTEALDHEDVDGLDKWLHSPKYRAINKDLGVD